MGLLVEFLSLGRQQYIPLGGTPLWLVHYGWYNLPLCWSLSALHLVVLVCLTLMLLWQQYVITQLQGMFDWVHSCSVIV